MIRNDLHVHSIRSNCGLHTFLEIVEIAARKGVRMVNICDHGSASGGVAAFGVPGDKRRTPRHVPSASGAVVSVLMGVEVNILDIDGGSDFPESRSSRFDLVSAGLHAPAKDLAAHKSPEANTRALANYLKRSPLDILTHPCIAPFPFDLGGLIDLALEYGFALEVNNTNLRVEKTDVAQLERMIRMAHDRGAMLLENSDGHTFHEIGENDLIEELLVRMKVDGDEVFMNRNDAAVDAFIEQRRALRGCAPPLT